jgi:DcmR-like sensory protein
MEEHAVQIYDEAEDLAASVTAYLAAGFEAGDPAVVLARREHAARFAEGLAVLGFDVGRLEEEGLLVVSDAEATLAAIMRGDRPSRAAFENVVGKLLDRVAKRFPKRQVRVFGELVDLLSERGQMDAAVALEELWERFGERRSFSLLCGYRLDLFDRAAQGGAVPAVCRLHSHVLPAHDQVRLARAVDRALEDVLGVEDAGKVYVLVGEEIREERVPAAQLALMWVSANLPALADRILAAARTHYAAEPLAA